MSCSRAASFELLPRSLIDPQVVGDRERQLDHVATVLPRVVLVRLDDLGEQQRDAAVGAAQQGRVLQRRRRSRASSESIAISGTASNAGGR